MSMESGFVKAAKMFGKGIAKTHRVANAITENTVGKAAEGVAWTMEKSGKIAFNGLTRKTEANFGNFYTGREVSKLGAVVFPAVGVAAGVGIYMNNTQFGPKPGTVSYSAEPPVMAGDGVSNAPTLNASGNMVFGLHNARKG